ncbi:FecR family protein [Parapedobacter koreensis]|uniref:FecR family protein n=1 Tax=Parapedobacter koreensis TaxID=332977 RepID=A0A1H7I587_9SPHI|nr:FecR family protein [Parapedobacter koreensis]SEK57598.1 FecR family protein [Parapedobacter koreensis]
MSRENFHRLLQRYLAGQCTPAEEQLVHHWYDMLEGRHEINPENLDTIENAIWDKIHEGINISHPERSFVHSSRFSPTYLRFWLVAAAVAIFLIGSGTFIYFRVICYPVSPSFVSEPMSDGQVITITNDTDHHMNIILSDESLVELYPGAVLEYPKRFKAKNREVRLSGDAFFAVAANLENPFWVFHEGMITKVLGTKFKIKSPKGNAKGEVIVYSGKVDVFYNVGNRNFVKRLLAVPEKASITTNQKAVLQPETIEETVMENPLPISTQVDAIRHETFKDVPMTTLAKTLSDLYALDVVADSSLAGTMFTGDLSGIGLFKQLDIICTVTNTQYEILGKTVFLRNKQ